MTSTTAVKNNNHLLLTTSERGVSDGDGEEALNGARIHTSYDMGLDTGGRGWAQRESAAERECWGESWDGLKESS